MTVRKLASAYGNALIQLHDAEALVRELREKLGSLQIDYRARVARAEELEVREDPRVIAVRVAEGLSESILRYLACTDHENVRWVDAASFRAALVKALRGDI